MKKVQAKKLIALLALLLLSSGCKDPGLPALYNYSNPLMVGEKKIFVEIARTPEQKTQGLSGRQKLTDSQGMLFIFDNPPSIPPLSKGGAREVRPAFWMKDMKFDLDLIWIREGKIIGITANVPHPKSMTDILPSYSPPANVDQILEVNAGWSKRNGVKAGDEIKVIDQN
ncbi:MAG: DUF192 domain-containing protein [Patescibacteria group bacterium]